jgi:hypothetical protein
MELNQVLSDKLRVKPLQPGETAKFELLNYRKKEPGRDEPSCPESYDLAEKETIYDPFANDGYGKKLVISHIVSYMPTDIVGGQSYDKPVLEKVKFIRGVVEVTSEEQDKYTYLMRSSKNITNPFRKKGSRAVFRQVNTKKEVYDAMQDADLTYEAEKLVREADWNEKRAIAVKLNQSPDAKLHVSGNITTDTTNILLQLITLAKKYPKRVIMSSGDIGAKQRVYISDALSFQLLLWNHEISTWSLYRPDIKAVNERIVELTTVEAGTDKIEALMEYFKTEEGRKYYSVLVTALAKILKATA